MPWRLKARAEELARKSGYASIPDGKQDALRHLIGSALFTKAYGRVLGWLQASYRNSARGSSGATRQPSVTWTGTTIPSGVISRADPERKRRSSDWPIRPSTTAWRSGSPMTGASARRSADVPHSPQHQA